MEFKQVKSFLSTKLQTLDGNVSLYVKFLNSKEEYKFKENIQFWAASTIKVPIVLTFFDKVKGLDKKINDKTKISNENYVGGSGILGMLSKFNTFTYKDLITLMLVVSDNTATNQIIDFVGRDSIQDYINNIGLLNTTFRHKMMVKEGRGPNLTTAYDMGLLLDKMYLNQLPGSIQILDIMQNQLDRSRIPYYLPNNIKISCKNGALPEALHEIGIVYSDNPFIFSFFSDNQKEKEITKDVLSQCSKYCYDYSISN